MDFSDDEDFFERAGEDEDDLLPFEGYECYQPPVEMPPEDEVSLEPEEFQEGSEPRESASPGEGSTEPSEEPSTSPSRCSDPASPASSSSLPALPLQTERGRKRLRHKTKPAEAAMEYNVLAPAEQRSYQPPGIPCVPSLDAVRSDWWDGKPEREKKRYFWNLVKRQNLYGTYLNTLSKWKRTQRPEMWSSLEPMHMREFLDWVLLLPALCLAQCVREWVREFASSGRAPEDPKNRDKDGNRMVDAGKRLLLTWQGPWGVVTRSEVTRATTELAATNILKKDRYIGSMWAKAMLLLQELKATLGAEEMGASLELCTRTFEQGSVRIHLHACYISDSARLRKVQLAALKVFDAAPHLSAESSKRQHRRRAAQHSGMYYVLAPKIGSIFTFATMQPHHEFEVNAEWIWSLVTLHKIELSAARRELVASGKNLCRHLPNLDLLMKERETEAMEDLIQKRDVAIAATRNAFKRIPAVEAWLKELSVPQDRRKFLVLDGPTRRGKTAFAFSLVEPGAALEVNCASVDDPPLRAFSRDKHRLILFDEASTHMVLKNKRLFQAPNTPVIVGSSPTNALTYSVFLGDTLLVVASNDWEQELAGLPAPLRDWLEGNMVFVSVQEKLYLEH